MGRFCSFLEEFVEDAKCKIEKRGKSKNVKNQINQLHFYMNTFFRFLRDSGGLSSLEDGFFEEDHRELLASFFEAISQYNWSAATRALQCFVVKKFLTYCLSRGSISEMDGRAANCTEMRKQTVAQQKRWNSMANRTKKDADSGTKRKRGEKKSLPEKKGASSSRHKKSTKAKKNKSEASPHKISEEKINEAEKVVDEFGLTEDVPLQLEDNFFVRILGNNLFFFLI